MKTVTVTQVENSRHVSSKEPFLWIHSIFEYINASNYETSSTFIHTYIILACVVFV